jgi:hypothetical protein
MIYHISGNALDFAISGGRLFVAEDSRGFGIYDLRSGQNIHRVETYNDLYLRDITLIRYYAPFQVLFVYDRTVASNNRLLLYRYDCVSDALSEIDTITGRTSNIGDIYFESIPSDPQRIRMFYGYFGVVNNLSAGTFTNSIDPDHDVLPFVQTPNRVNSIDTCSDYIYTAMGQRGLYIVDRNLSSSYQCATPGVARDIKVKNNVAYIADTYAGLTLIDVSDITNLSLLDTYTIVGNARSVDISGDYLAVGSSNVGLILMDISDPTSPAVIDILPTSRVGSVQKVMFFDDLLYITSSDFGIMRIRIKK